MRVLHVNKFLYRRGGAEGYLFDLAALQRARGDEVAYFGMAHPDNDSPQRYGHFFPPYVQLEPPPPGISGRAAAVGRMLHSPASRRGLARVIADFRPDVVHAHNVYHQLSPSVLRAAADAGVPCVLTMHDYKLACPSYQLLAGRAVCDACVTGGPWQAVRTRCKDGSLGRSAVLAAETWAHRVTGAYGPVRAFVSPSRFLADVMARAGSTPTGSAWSATSSTARSSRPRRRRVTVWCSPDGWWTKRVWTLSSPPPGSAGSGSTSRGRGRPGPSWNGWPPSRRRGWCGSTAGSPRTTCTS
ncbi:hypothetical protein Psuf_081300 [Phytohabitans suffuscus]|uniref:Glycosyltransferase subfamily 4-like N-terminal domain-containing protein n=1 Tax=Phytohabitans suffuscus TaxID=624315 RepID=A0A6F8YXF4_9ACTN|nr:hypothetical protein Psuf_081300 [Phytohabitans suffuscus]